MKRTAGTSGQGEPTVAPMPGTTLGLLRVPGVPLGPKQRVFDTPGVRHAYQLTTRLPLEEVSMVLPRRRLKPRTWRVGAGFTLLIGGLARVDVVECPGTTLYLTAFVSDDITCHMGRSEGAEERREKHAGGLLAPPLTAARLQELGPLLPRDAAVEGDAWDRSSADVAIAGLGWVAVGVKGGARLRVWAPEGVAVTSHAALVPDFAKDFQRPGWSDLLPAKNRARLQEAAAAAEAGESLSGGGGGGGSGGGGGAAAAEEEGLGEEGGDRDGWREGGGARAQGPRRGGRRGGGGRGGGRGGRGGRGGGGGRSGGRGQQQKRAAAGAR
jgi:uncharacterized membrane protein YgcG